MNNFIILLMFRKELEKYAVLHFLFEPTLFILIRNSAIFSLRCFLILFVLRQWNVGIQKWLTNFFPQGVCHQILYIL